MSKKQNEWLGMLGTILLSTVLFLIIGKGNLNFGLYDDNQSQWLPIIDRAYQTFLDTGKLPAIDFFQMKGMKIFDQGYYGLWNPFMLIAYLIRTYLLSSFSTNTLSVYIFMMILLGNLCSYGIFRKFGISLPGSVLLSSCMMSVSIYVALNYWYYIYNVYFILSWLILEIVKQEDRRSYYKYGGILALSLFMGNIQYTVYMVLAFTLIMLILFLRGNREAGVKLISNGICMGILSTASLLMLLQASARSVSFSGDNSQYYHQAFHALAMALFSWFPSFTIGNLSGKIEDFLYTNIPLPGVSYREKCMYIGIIVCAAAIFLLHKKKYKKDKYFEIAFACFITAGIFLLLSFGKTGLLAIVVKEIPFLGHFRHPIKYLALVPILFLPCIAIIVREQKSFWNLHTGLLCVFLFLGILQNRYIASGLPQIQTDKSIERLEELGVDYHNYRVMGFSTEEELKFVKTKICYEQKFAKNAATTAGVVTLSGYDLSVDYKQYQMSNYMMGTLFGYDGPEFGFANIAIEDYFLERLQKDQPDYQINIEKFRAQMMENGVKYYIFTKDSASLSWFRQLLDDLHMQVEWQQDFLEDTVIVAVADIPSLVQQGDGEKINTEITMNKIVFSSDGNSEFRVSMYYDKNLRARYVGEDGEKITLSVRPDEKGYVVVSGAPASGYGKVEIDYCNHFYMICEIWNAAALIIIAIMLWAPETGVVKRMSWRVVCFVKEKIAAVDFTKVSKVVFVSLLCIYVVFMGIYYFHTGCTVPDEDEALQMFRLIHDEGQGKGISYLKEIQNYLGYGQIFWILGGICPYVTPLRLVFYAMLMGSLFLTLNEVKYYYGKEMIPYAGILWLSMPFAWFDGNIIGPEIMGLFSGILGLCLIKRKNLSWVGWLLLGVSCAVKMNGMVFLLAALLEKLWSTQSKKVVTVAKGVLISGSGYLISNPIIFWNLPDFLQNMEREARSLEALADVFSQRKCEWDGVISNGVFWGYISVVLFVLIIVGRILLRSYNCKREGGKELYHKNCVYGNIAGVLSVGLILICCREIFSGQNLLPLCYLGVIFICGEFYYDGGQMEIRNFLYRALAICLLINGLILLPEHVLQRENDIRYMQVQSNSEEMQKRTADAMEVIKQERPDAKKYYLMDHHTGKYTYNFQDYADFCVNDEEGIAVIGERMRCVKKVDKVVENAIKERDNLRVLWHEGNVWIIVRENL